jgi:hypothetical protein
MPTTQCVLFGFFLLKTHQCYVNPLDIASITVSQTGDTVNSDIEAECAHATPQALSACKIPKVVHLVMLGGSFKFHHYISVRSIYQVIQPDALFIHGYAFPIEEPLFQQAMTEFNITLAPSRVGTKVYDKWINQVEHKSDLNRLENIIRFGGMYFDLDVFITKPMDVYLGGAHETVMGAQPGRGLNNGMLIGKRCSRFFRRWHEAYSYFNDNEWDTHSIWLPGDLHNKNVAPIHVDSAGLVNNWPSTWMFDVEYQPDIWIPIRAVQSFYRDYQTTHDFEDIKKVKNNFGRFVRWLVYNGPAMGDGPPENVPVKNETDMGDISPPS